MRPMRPMRAKVVGTVSLDLLYTYNTNKTAYQMQMAFGGVCKNVACVLGALGMHCDFISARYSGDMGRAIANYFQEHLVTWTPLEQIASPGLFQAHIDAGGQVFDESFSDNGSLEMLTPEVIQQSTHLFDNADTLITCTNLSVASLNALHDIARRRNAPYCVLVSSDLEAERLPKLAHKPDFIGMNQSEMRHLTGKTYTHMTEIATDARALVADDGACLVTLGEKGALLALPSEAQFVFQPTDPVEVKSPVGAGDVLFTTLLVHRYHHKTSWEAALHQATRHTRAYLRRPADDYPIYSTLHQLEAISQQIWRPYRV